MKLEQISEHVWSLRTWLIIPIRVWLVTDTEGVTLVDAGMPFMARGILKAIDHLQAGPLRRILLTHGHEDHVGAVPSILDRHPVPVFAHPIELPYLSGEQPYPRRPKPKATLRPGLAQPLPDSDAAYLGGVEAHLTPGHSPGHVIYHHSQDRVTLAGDLFTSRSGRLRKPMAMFTADMEEAVRSSRIISELKPDHLEICHGGPVKRPAEQIEDYLRAAGHKG